jgi:hypothetical protein
MSSSSDSQPSASGRTNATRRPRFKAPTVWLHFDLERRGKQIANYTSTLLPASKGPYVFFQLIGEIKGCPTTVNGLLNRNPLRSVYCANHA